MKITRSELKKAGIEQYDTYSLKININGENRKIDLHTGHYLEKGTIDSLKDLVYVVFMAGRDYQMQRVKDVMGIRNDVDGIDDYL